MHTTNYLAPDGVPLISVMIVCYSKNAQYVERALLSICKQTFQNIEVLVCYDGSLTEGDIDSQLLNKAAAGCPFPVYIFDMPAPCGTQQPVRNRYTSHCLGRYIYNMDADNEIEPTHLEELLKAIRTPDEQGHRPAFVYSRRRYVKDPLCTRPMKEFTAPFIKWHIGRALLARGSKYNFIDTGDLLIPKSVLYTVAEQTGEIWNCNIPRYPDYDLVKRMAQCGFNGRAVDCVTNVYHWTGENIQLTQPQAADISVLNEAEYEDLILRGYLRT